MDESTRTFHRELQRLRAQLEQPESEISRNELHRFIVLFEALLDEIENERKHLNGRVDRLRDNQRQLDSRVRTLEYSRMFRAARWVGNSLRIWRGRAGQALLRSPFHPLYLKLVRPPALDPGYQRWIDREQASLPSPEAHKKQAASFQRRPLISIVLPVHNPKREWLDAAVGSVLAQTYPLWELCVCDDASREPWVTEYFAAQAGADNRIRFTPSGSHLGISGALNMAGQMAQGEYVGFLDQDDVLSPFALHYVVKGLQENSPDFIYTDEDKLDSSGRRVEPMFRPEWSPDLLTGCMYLGHFLVVSKNALNRTGWFRSDFDGSQDYDLALRLAEHTPVVRHVSRVLYHWRKHPGSSSADPAAKPYTHAAGRRALEAAVLRRQWSASVEHGPFPNTYRLRRHVSGEPLASLVICSRNAKLLSRCLRSIRETTSYHHYEIVVVQHKTGDHSAVDQLLATYDCKHVPFTGPFNFSAMNNLGSQVAGGEILVFLNDDVEPLVPDWLAALIAQVQRPEIGIAGARLLYPSGAVQHAGMVLGMMDGAGHPHRGEFGGGYWNWRDLTRNVSAVTGACLAIRKKLFQEVDGFDTSFPLNYNDVDLCLRIRKAGLEVIYEASAELRHYECQTRVPGATWEERERWHEIWEAELPPEDPYYSPHLSRNREDASLRLEE